MKVKFEKEHLKAIKTYVCCPDCDRRLEYTGRIHHSDPVSFPHFCRNCNQLFYLEEKYPRVELLERDKN